MRRSTTGTSGSAAFSFSGLAETRLQLEALLSEPHSVDARAMFFKWLHVFEDLVDSARQSGMDVAELCRIMKEEVFVPTCRSATTRSMTSYANRHINGGPSQMYDLCGEVGRGAFGSVYKAHHRQTGQYHAVKSIPKDKVDPTDLWAEMDIMKQLDHPHVMRLYNTFEDADFLYMSAELCAGGSFFDTLRKAGHLAEQVACRLFRQISGVVSYLHSRSICHRDIKPENFLVLKQCLADDLHLKLIDFGTSKRFDLAPMVTKVCTPHYVAPEVLNPKCNPYTEKVDIWSCGVILFVMLCGHLPFNKDNTMELLKLVKKGKFEFEPAQVWTAVSETAQDLIRRILCVHVHERVTADEAFHHPWCVSSQRLGAEDQCPISENMIAQILRYLTDNRLKRVALRIIARQIDDDVIESQRSVWLYLDSDNSGTLTLDEMNKAVMQLCVSDVVRAGMVEIMCQLDPTNSGNVEYTEFLAASMDMQQYLQEDICRAAFVRLDFDGDGIVSRKDLGRLLSDHDGMRDAGLTGASIAELIDEVEHIMDEADANGDGGVSFEEFMDLMADPGPLLSKTATMSRSERPGHADYADGLKQLWATELAGVVPEGTSVNSTSPF